MTDLAQLTIVEAKDRTLTISILGEIDASNAQSVAIQLNDVCTKTTALTIDLTAVTYLDSQGLRIIQALADRHTRGELVLTLRINPTDIISRLLTITGLDQVRPITSV